jgi:hypothetical protein
LFGKEPLELFATLDELFGAGADVVSVEGWLAVAFDGAFACDGAAVDGAEPFARSRAANDDEHDERAKTEAAATTSMILRPYLFMSEISFEGERLHGDFATRETSRERDHAVSLEQERRESSAAEDRRAVVRVGREPVLDADDCSVLVQDDGDPLVAIVFGRRVDGSLGEREVDASSVWAEVIVGFVAGVVLALVDVVADGHAVFAESRDGGFLDAAVVIVGPRGWERTEEFGLHEEKFEDVGGLVEESGDGTVEHHGR